MKAALVIASCLCGWALAFGQALTESQPPAETTAPNIPSVVAGGTKVQLIKEGFRVANTNGEFIIAFDIQPDGSVRNRRNFARLEGVRQTETGVSSGADGLAVDAAGRLYVASTAGVQVFSPQGQHLGTIPIP